MNRVEPIKKRKSNGNRKRRSNNKPIDKRNRRKRIAMKQSY
jgi:hypothetical protein